MAKDTKKRLIETGMALLLERGYTGLGIMAVLDATGTPKGSFYHHFRDKEDFALQIVDAYVGAVHDELEACLSDTSRPPLERIRAFFATTIEHYRQEGYMGCLMGGIGQELAATSEVFRVKIAGCFASISQRISVCLSEAKAAGALAAEVDVRQFADLIVDAWEGAALRSRLRRDPRSLHSMLDFYLAGSSAPDAAERTPHIPQTGWLGTAS